MIYNLLLSALSNRALEEGNEYVSAGIINERGAEWLVTGVGRIHSLDDIGATVVAAQVDYDTKEATVQYDTTKLAPENIMATIDATGFNAEPASR